MKNAIQDLQKEHLQEMQNMLNDFEDAKSFLKKQIANMTQQ